MQKRDNKLKFWEVVVDTAVGVALMFYYTLLAKVVWGWFIADKVFEVTYWELFIGLIVVRFMLDAGATGKASMRINRIHGMDTFQEELSLKFARLMSGTIIFGVLFIVNLIISYYS